MSWKRLRRTDVVEAAATAVMGALQRSIEEHQRLAAAIRRDLKARGSQQ